MQTAKSIGGTSRQTKRLVSARQSLSQPAWLQVSRRVWHHNSREADWVQPWQRAWPLVSAPLWPIGWLTVSWARDRWRLFIETKVAPPVLAPRPLAAMLARLARPAVVGVMEVGHGVVKVMATLGAAVVMRAVEGSSADSSTAATISFESRQALLCGDTVIMSSFGDTVAGSGAGHGCKRAG